jgi:hypothetical protein
MTTPDSRRQAARHQRPGLAPLARRAVAVVGGLLLALAISAPAFADAELVGSSPDDKAILETPPTTITLTFSDGLDAGRSSFKLISAGTTVGTGKASTTGAKVMTLDGLALDPGAYQIRWTAGATDGHITRGKLTFSVAETASVPPTPAPTSTPASAPTITPTSKPSTPATAGPTAAPTGSDVSTAGATGAPGGDGTTAVAASPADVLIPIAVGLIAVVGIGALVLRRSRAA